MSRGAHLRAGALGLLALLALTGCTTGGQKVPSTPPTSAATTPPAPPSDAPQSYAQASAQAVPLMLQPSDYPGQGWTPGGKVAVDDFAQVVCGVATEPRPPAGSFVSKVLNGSTTMVVQTVRPVGQQQADEVVSGLAAAVPGCSSDTRTGANGATVRYEMAPVQLTQPDTVAYRQRMVDPQERVYAYLVYFRQGGNLVAFATWSSAPKPPVAFLDALVDAVRKKG